jgi:transcriptional regulator with XRE-family HTH domain
MSIRDQFIQEIEGLLASRQIQKAELCRKVGISRSVLDDFLNRKKDIKLDTFERILAGFGNPPEIVFLAYAAAEQARADQLQRALESQLREAIKNSKKTGTLEHFKWAFTACVNSVRPARPAHRRGRAKETLDDKEVHMAAKSG